MEDSKNGLLSPWLIHLQKLSLTLKCPICMDVLNQPVLLPCDHLFCSECIHKQTKDGSRCHVCKSQYVDQETRPAHHMENVISVFRSLCSTSVADLFRPLESGNHGNIKNLVKTSGEENSVAGRDEDKLAQSQPPGQLVSVGRKRSPGKVNKDAKRQKKSNLSEVYKCGFCHSSEVTDETGPMLHFSNQEQVGGDLTSYSKVINVHKVCIDWTPRVYYEDNKIKNLEIELARAAKLRCGNCGEKGAPLGCYVKACRKTYHSPCALKISDCRWDHENCLMLCPSHKSTKFPKEMPEYEKCASMETNPLVTHLSPKQSEFWSTSSHGAKTWVFCGSALSSMDLCYMVKFASNCGATVAKFWRPDVTHVITTTNANGACTRTMKVLMAILHGRWIISMDWIKSCAAANRPLDEKHYEIALDNHGARDGPKTGRYLTLNNGPKLFDNLVFYFSGDFDLALLNDLKNLVLVAGGTSVEKKEFLVPQSCDIDGTSKTLIVYKADQCTSGDKDCYVLEIPKEAQDMALRISSRVIQHTWILESIAACKLQPLSCY